jgi:signal transduction histidine kinase
MRFFVSNGLRAEESYREARMYNARGCVSRVVFASGASAVAAMVLDWRIVIAQYVTVLAWEALSLLITGPAVDRLAKTRSYDVAMGWMAVLAFIGSCIYASYAACLFVSHSGLAVYLGTAWLMGALLYVHVYHSNCALLLIPQVVAPASLLVMAPFIVLTDTREAAASSAALFLLLAAFAQFSRDRNQLLEKVEQERREKRAAEAANAAKSRFLAVMSHELRTPLNAIIGYSEMMREDAEADQRASDVRDHDRVLGAGRRLLHMIGSVLDLTKLEVGGAELEIAEQDLPGMLNDVREIIGPLAAENGNRVVVEAQHDLGPAWTDGFKLSQCLLNLASNAAKFTRDGRILISARMEAGLLVFVVSDNGIGIAAEKLAHIFEPFVQADESITRTYGGSGLGLAITRRIARLLGGDVSVASVEGEGSTFTLTAAVDMRPKVVTLEAPRRGAANVCSEGACPPSIGSLALRGAS